MGVQRDDRPKISDHFNGKKFINPTLEKPFSPGFSDLFKMLKTGRAKWPISVKNTAVPRLHETLEPGDVAITYVNHATFIIQFQNLHILIDPVWSLRASPLNWIGPKRIRKPGVELSDLPDMHVLLLSHNHYDHFDKKTLKKLSRKFAPQVLVPLGDKKLVESTGFTNVRDMDWWESITLDDHTKITFTPTQHSSARGLMDRDKSLWGSFYIEHKNHRIFYGGDGGYSTHFSEIAKRMGAPDIAILGIGAYEPHFFMQAIHTSPQEAVQAHLDLGARQSIGMHFGTFQLASEGYDQPLTDLRDALKKENLARDEFITLEVGETRIFHKDADNRKEV